MTAARPDHLRDSLHELAGEVQATDLYDRAVRRSRRIARREAAIGSGAALLALGVLAAGLWRVPAGETGRPPVAVLASPAPPTGGSVAASPSSPPVSASARATTERPSRVARKAAPRMVEPPAEPRSRTLADLPGRVFYAGTGDRPDVLRLRPADGTTDRVLAGAPSPVGISPDGDRIAYVADGTLLVGSTDDGDAEPLAEGVATTDQAPAWSPDGERLLVHTTAPAVVEVGSGDLTPLPAGLLAGRHFRWSGDGSKLVYATSACGLQVAAAGVGVAVPLTDPEGLACRADSVDSTARRVAVADAVVDTETGDVVALPVTGTVLGAVFDARGNLLVRTLRAGVTRLSLIGPDNALVVQAVEPESVRELRLIAYTR